MSNAIGNIVPNNNKRFIQQEERSALCDIGYSVKNIFGSVTTRLTTTNFGPYNYGGATSCAGITIAGTNDGINPTTFAYTFAGNINTNIPISCAILLSNDTSPTGNSNDLGIEYLQDLTTGITLLTTGISTSTVNINSSVSGLHLLRYIPTYGFQKGNITYVYVFINDNNVSCAIPNICNLVSNGDFEQYSSLNIPYGGITNSCGWKTASNGSPDYFNAGNIGSSPFNVPCNAFGTQTSNNSIGNAYAGIGFNVPIFNINAVFAEHLYTKLASPLLAGTTYQLSFDVSLAEGSSSFAYQLQAYFSINQLPQLSTSGYLLPSSGVVTSLVDITTRTNYNGWDKITFNYTATGGEQYLYIGGLQTQQITQITAAPVNTSCNNGNYDTYYNQPANLQYRGSYYYLDNIKLVAASLDLPASVCVNSTLNDLRVYLSPGTPPTGTFSGQSVGYNSVNGLYSFQPQTGITSSIITYTYTNNLGCTITLSDTIIVNIVTTPTFNTIPVLCQGSIPPVLPTTSTNGITGTWNPLTISTAQSGNYTFTPTPGQCAVAVSRGIQVLRNDAFITNADAFTVTLGSYVTASVTTPSVLINDTYNGGAIPATISGVPYTLVLTGTPPTFPSGGITFNATTGTFTVAPNTTAGTYVYKYYLQNSCYNMAAPTVKIVVNSLRYENQIGLSFCYGTTAANSGTTLYQGTTVNGVQTNSTNATITVINPTTLLPTPLPTGITSISANGSVNLAAGILPGQITFYYRICSTSFGSCTVTKTCVVTIERTFFANSDAITTLVGANGSVTYNVRSNDTYRGGCGNTNLVPATSSNTTITNVVPDLPYYTINQTTGAIQGAGTQPTIGSHLMQYTLCDNANLNICQTVSVIINVPSLRMNGVNNVINNFDIEKTIISPNPTFNNVTITFNDSIKEEFYLELYDLLGRLLIQKQIQKDTLQYELDLTNYASANYLIKIFNNENGTNLSKTIIKH